MSRRYGFDRGTPVDRRLIDEFFMRHRAAITGRVLEVGGTHFTERFGRDVCLVDVVDVDPRNDRATILADLADDGCLAGRRYDCVVVPQTLQYVADLDTACANLWGAVDPGGTLLVTVPAVAKVDHHLRSVDRWRMTPAGLQALLVRCCVGGEVAVDGPGNVLLAVAFLLGVAADELDEHELTSTDVDFPVLATAAVRRS